MSGKETAEHGGGMPGLRGMEHVGFTVPNLDEAIRFFVDILGCEPFYELGPFTPDGDWMERHLNVHPDAVSTAEQNQAMRRRKSRPLVAHA